MKSLWITEKEFQEMQNKISRLEWSNKQNVICIEYYTLKFNKARKIIKKLKRQIEKMKCCENCKNWVDSDCVLSAPLKCKRWCEDWQDDYWELAE